LVMRYLFAQTHYRKPLNFTWESVKASTEGYMQLKNKYQQLTKGSGENASKSHEELSGGAQFMLKTLREDIADDLNTAKLLGDVWYMLKEEKFKPHEYIYILDRVNRILGLELSSTTDVISIPEHIDLLAKERQQARNDNNFQKSDELRKQIEDAGYSIEDADDGYVIQKK
ncbi:hypothetical protein COY15_03085, partial [Candidatus Roizmanbacteria bacterium CG_4_10_14_0_2_um_filter_39_12]